MKILITLSVIVTNSILEKYEPTAWKNPCTLLLTNLLTSIISNLN